MKTAHFLTLFAAVAGPLAAQANWPRLPFVPEMPVNLASGSLGGTTIESALHLDHATSLLSEDATVGTTLPNGKSEVIVRLAGQEIVEVVRFLNDGIEGAASVSAGIDGRIWVALGRTAFGPKTRIVETRFAGAHVRYVKLTFDLARGGSIRTFKLYGRPLDKDYDVQGSHHPAEQGDEVSSGGLNWASGFDHSRPTFAHPQLANLDQQRFAENLYSFPQNGEKYRTVVYDLGGMRDIDHFSTAYSTVPTRVEVFVFSNLPEKRDWRGKISLDPAIFDMVDPVATGVDPEGVGHMKHVPKQPVSARYVAIRYSNSSSPKASRPQVSAVKQGDLTRTLCSVLPRVSDAFSGASSYAPFLTHALGGVLDRFGPGASYRFTQSPRGLSLEGLPLGPIDVTTTDGNFVATIEIADIESQAVRRSKFSRGVLDAAPALPPIFGVAPAAVITGLSAPMAGASAAAVPRAPNAQNSVPVTP